MRCSLIHLRFYSHRLRREKQAQELDKDSSGSIVLFIRSENKRMYLCRNSTRLENNNGSNNDSKEGARGDFLCTFRRQVPKVESSSSSSSDVRHISTKVSFC